MSGARQHFGLKNRSEVAGCVLALEIRQFYKSMTVIGDSSLWQDVYHASVRNRTAYVKLQIANGEAVIISFKNLEDD